ncbi:putative trypsin-like serine protease, partial [Operophtera brumata]
MTPAFPTAVSYLQVKTQHTPLKSQTITGILLLVSISKCQFPVHHPGQQGRYASIILSPHSLTLAHKILIKFYLLLSVSFTQTSADWPNPQLQQSNPPWNEFPAPRKRTPEFVQPNYNSNQAYSYNSGPVPNDGRLLSESAFTKISETLGAINTVGHYLVDMVNDEHENDDADPNLEQLPHAFYTISKNVLGRNVTDKIAPFVRKALPKVLPDAPITKIATANDRNDVKFCTTPEGQEGICEDLSNCPQLLLNLVNLRESLCFKDLFVPGVCCPKDAIVTTPVPERPVVATTSKPTYLVPVTTQKPKPQTTKRPSAVLVLTTKKPKQTPKPVTTTRKPTTIPSTTVTTPRPIRTTTFYYSTVAPPVVANFSNIVDMDDCGEREDEGGRIVGGTESKPGHWPWMAAIFLHGSKRREFWCGGTLVGKRYVLTAAHCTRDSKQRPFPPRQFSVRLGDIDLSRDDEPSRPVTLRVTSVRAHEQFSRVGFYNDIAILVLS